MRKLVLDETKLCKPSKPLEFITEDTIDTSEGVKIINSIKAVMEANKDLVALAAPQIGLRTRIFCIRFNDVIKTFINPIITKKSGSSIGPEICASMPGKEILIARPDELTVVYYTDEFKYEDNKLLGAAARVFDQMYQILDGILPSELGLVSDPETDGSLFGMSEEDMQELCKVYKQYVETKQKALMQQIEADKDYNSVYKKLNFTENVINGRTQVVANEDEETKQFNKAIKIAKHKEERARAKADFDKFLSKKRR